MILIVALEGRKVLTEEGSVEPLRYAVRQMVRPEDQVVVLVIFNSGEAPQSPEMSGCCIGTDGRRHQPSERERCNLREEISQGTESYMKVFKPFYRDCKNIRVNFMVKVVFGPMMDAIILEEKNNIGATSVVIGRSFAIQHAAWTTQTKTSCRLTKLFWSNGEEIIVYNCNPSNDVPESSSRAQNAAYLTKKMPGFMKKHISRNDQKLTYTLPNFEGIYGPSSSSPSFESANESSHESEGEENIEDQIILPSAHEDGSLVELTWEVISDITDRFMDVIQIDSSEGFQMYRGYLKDRRSDVFVKRYVGSKCRYVLEAEKKAALTMYHKNILRLYGFHKNENAMALVFPFTSRSGGALLNRFLNGAWTKELEVTFQNKLNIAIGIAQGLRYMHEQCTQGLIVHCDLRPCNVLLGNNFVPQITGFGHAKWLQTDRISLTRNSCGHMHPSDLSSLTLIKYDVLAFGILLLRLFCKRSAPRDDKGFLTWARSLLAQRAYHILYDESEQDVHGLLVVTSVAERCISTRSNSRPCMSKVLSFLKGEVTCAEQTFPSTESSPNLASTPDFEMWEI